MAADTWTAPADWTSGEKPVASSKLNQQIRDNLTVVRNVLEDDSSGEWAHGHKTGTLVNRPTPGEVGRLYLPTDLPMLLQDDGTEWLVAGDGDPRKTQVFHGELAAGVGTSGDMRQWELRDFTGTGTVVDAASGTQAVRLSTGTTVNSLAIMRTRRNIAHFDPTTIFLLILGVNAETATSANQALYAGVFTNNQAEFIGVRKGGTGNWSGVVRNGGGDSGTIDMGVGGSTGTQFFIIERRAAAIHFFHSTFNSAGEKGNISASLPTANMHGGMLITDNPGGGDRRLAAVAFDYWKAL